MAYTDWYTWRLVDLAGNIIEDNLQGLSGGRVTGNVATAIRWQGTVTSETPPWWDLWRTRLQPVYHRTGREPEVVGTFHARPETWDYDGGRHTTKLALYDPTIHVQEDETWGLWTETKGLNIAGRVRVILNTIGLRVAVTPSAETLRRDLVFEDTVTKLRVINDLLDAGGFFALHVDPFGQFQVVPYTPPQQRPVVYSFSERIDAEHTRNVSGTYAQTVPNKVIVKSRGDGDAPDLIAIAQDQQDFYTTGVWRSRTYSHVEASSQAVLEAHAKRLLSTARDTSTTRRHKMLPRRLAINDVVSDGTGTRFVIESIDRVLESGQTMPVDIREVK